MIAWVDKDLNVHEIFVRLHQIDDTNVEAISEKITTSSSDMNLNVHQMKEECYDDASVMSSLITSGTLPNLTIRVQSNIDSWLWSFFEPSCL